MAYADYDYYVNQYQGSAIAEADFPRLARLASAYLEGIARIPQPPPDAARDACCAVAEAWQGNERGGEVLSETNDGYTVAYAASNRSGGRRLYEAAALFLGPAGLLCAWV